MKHFIKCIFLCAVILFSGCTVKEQVRVDLDKFTRDQASYINEDVVITATLEDVVLRYDLYRGKKIETSAPFIYFGKGKFWPWSIMLQKDEHSLRCYSHHYKSQPSNAAINMLGMAKSKNEPITILGVLNKDGIDIEEISYNGASVRTDMSAVPNRMHLFALR
jgi:hypothetical protein